MEKTLEEIQRDVRNWYCHKLDTMQIENEFDLILYCSYAGRLYSLGIEQYMSKANDLLYNSSYSNEVNQIFLDRIEQGIWDLQEQTGKEVGISLTELQDMHSFLKHTSYPFSDQVRQSFADWIEAGHYADVNDETFDYINDFFDANPLDYSDILEELVEPTTQEVRELEYLLSGCRYAECQPQEVNGVWEFSDDGYNLRLEFKPSAENALCFEVYERQLDGKVPVEGVSIRQDILPAVQDLDSPLNWSIDYSHFLGLDNSKRKHEPLTIRLPMGGICKIPVPIATSSDVPIATSNKMMFTRITLIEHYNYTRLSAAGKKQVKIVKCSVEGTSATLVFTVDYSREQVLVNVCPNKNRGLFSDELDGFQLYSCENICLGVIKNAFAKFKFSQFDGSVELRDANGKVQQLTVS